MRLDFARIVNQFDDRELSAIAVAMAQFQDARVTTGPILVALSEFVKEPLERRDSGSAFRSQLTTLASELADADMLPAWKKPAACRRRCNARASEPSSARLRALRESVIARSTNGRNSFAFGKVVTMRSRES